MRLVRWASTGGVQVGRIEGEATAVPVSGDVLELARRATLEPGWIAPAVGVPVGLEGLRMLPPVERPGALRDFSAFERHVAVARARRGLAMDRLWYALPVFYFSNPAAILGPDDEVAPPPRSVELDFELELAWVVGRDVAGADLDAAARAVVGYTVMNDWSARDLQRDETALSLGPVKAKDFATSLGPVLVTADEFDPAHGAMRAEVNGRLYSQADLSDCWWSVAEMTAYAAEATVVRAGDVLATGTCGTGCILELSFTHGSGAYPWLHPGDLVELEIDGIGRLVNRVARPTGQAWHPAPDRSRPRGVAP